MQRFICTQSDQFSINSRTVRIKEVFSLLFGRMSSQTFYKYCSAVVDKNKPVEPGQRVGITRDLEQAVPGYKALQRELLRLREVIKHQKDNQANSSLDKPVRTKYYKSLMGIR